MSLYNKNCKIGNGDMTIGKSKKALYFNVLRMINRDCQLIFRNKYYTGQK